MEHPAYPTSAQRASEYAAENRAIHDRKELCVIWAMVGRWRAELAPRLARLESPGLHWQPDDLDMKLQETLADIDNELDRLRGSLVIEDSDE